MGYSIEEQETVAVFDNKTKKWSVYSTVPKHIRKLLEITEVEVVEMESDRPIAVRAVLEDKQISMKKVRVLSEEQRQAQAARLAKVRKNKTQEDE